MRVTIIGCPFKTAYGPATESLKKAIEKRTGQEVPWVASNCGCDDEAEINRDFQMQGCRYFDMLAISDYRSQQPWKYWLRLQARNAYAYLRARKYRKLASGAEVVHFQQTLHSYGSTVLFHWLQQKSSAARVVTVHELDRHQQEHPQGNQAYNRADAIVVQHGALKQQLVGLGVDPDRIEIVLHGTELPPLDDAPPREGILYYAGHHPLNGKGLDAVLRALTLLKSRRGAAAAKCKLHGYFGLDDMAVVKAKIAALGLQDELTWLNQLSMPETLSVYRRSQVCLLPFTGSSAGLAAATAAAVETPVIGTRHAGIAEHLGENVLWVADDCAEQIAEQIERLQGSPELGRDLGRRLRCHAEGNLSWDLIADKTMAVYQRALQRKSGAAAVAGPA